MINYPFGVDALVVNTVRRGPGQMAGMGADSSSTAGNLFTSIADTLTGGQVSATEAKLDELELLLKVSIGASIVSGALALFVLFSGKR